MLLLGFLLPAIAQAALFSLNQSQPVKLQATNANLASVVQLLFVNPIWRKAMLLVPYGSGQGVLGRLQQTVAAMMMASAEEAVDLQSLEGAIHLPVPGPQAMLHALFRIMPKEVQVSEDVFTCSNCW